MLNKLAKKTNIPILHYLGRFRVLNYKYIEQEEKHLFLLAIPKNISNEELTRLSRIDYTDELLDVEVTNEETYIKCIIKGEIE